MMTRMVALFCIENDTPFSQQLLQKKTVSYLLQNAPFIRMQYTVGSEALTPPEVKRLHRSGEICSDTKTVRDCYQCGSNRG